MGRASPCLSRGSSCRNVVHPVRVLPLRFLWLPATCHFQLFTTKGFCLFYTHLLSTLCLGAVEIQEINEKWWVL